MPVGEQAYSLEVAKLHAVAQRTSDERNRGEMLNSELIYQRAEDTVQRCGTRKPDEIARTLGVTVYDDQPFEDLLGMYICRWKHRVVFLSGSLDEYLRDIVLAHELGHDAFHRKLAGGNGLQEFSLFDMRTITEYEANAFAAHLLLDGDEVLSLAREGLDIQQMAQTMNTRMNLLLIKMQEMNRLGSDFRLPSPANGSFLKNERPV